MNEEERSRLWQYRLHEDMLFNERQNFFLLAESLLAIAYTEAFTSRVGGVAVEVGVAAAALVLTIAWFYVNRRQHYLVRHVHEVALGALPEFAAAYRARKPTRLGSTRVLAFGVPLLVGLMWLLGLVAAVTVS